MSSLFAALGIVFLAELGDKTQLVALGFGARYRTSVVLCGVALGYMLSGLLSVIIGGVLGATLPTNAISIGGGLLFVAFAVWTLWKGEETEEAADELVADAATEIAAEIATETTAAETTAPETASPGSAGAGVLATEAVGWNPRVVLSIAGAMFVAELGDKTMLATATLAAKGNPVLVWIGATIGIMLAGTVGVMIGKLLGDRLPERVIMIGSSVLFLVFGVVLIATGIVGAT